MSKRILVSSAGWHAALCCVESLSRNGWTVDILTTSRWMPAALSRRTTNAILTPAETDAASYMQKLEETLSAATYDLFIPISDLVVEHASQPSQMIRSYTRMVLPERSSITAADDKGLTMELAAKLGIPCPETLLPSSIAEVDASVEKLGMPCVVKLRRGSGSAGVLTAHTAVEVAEFVEVR